MPNEKKNVLGTFAASILLSASALIAAPASAMAPQPGPLDEWDRYAYCASGPPPLYGDPCCDDPALTVPCEEPRPLEPAILYQEENSEPAGL